MRKSNFVKETHEYLENSIRAKQNSGNKENRKLEFSPIVKFDSKKDDPIRIRTRTRIISKFE